MRILDIDLDYFMLKVFADISSNSLERAEEDEYGSIVWSEKRVREFLENNLGLSEEHKTPGRIVTGHDEALYFWEELIDSKQLSVPFKVVHVDSHADLGLGYLSNKFIIKTLLKLPPEERANFEMYSKLEGALYPDIGDYLLFAIAFRWIEKLTYCSNPIGDCDDYLWFTMKDFYEPNIGDYTTNSIQLLHNNTMEIPRYSTERHGYKEFIDSSIPEPEVPFEIIHTIEGVMFNGKFDFISFAQSPNYTPESADYIMNIMKDYIIEI